MSDKLSPAEILAKPENLKCTCAEADCKWHGVCAECVALHRYYGTYPNCLSGENEKDYQ